MGSRLLRKLQLGQESVAGTICAATTVWGGPADSIVDNRNVVFPKQDWGRLSESTRSYTPTIGALYEMPETEVTAQQICHVLQAAHGASAVTADTGTGATGKIRTYLLPTTAANVPKTYTLEAGDDQQAYVMEYAYVSKYKILGKSMEALKMSATWEGRQKALTTFTPALSVPTNLDEILFTSGKLYIDPTTIGTTIVSSTLLALDAEIVPGNVARYSANGNLYFAQVRQGSPSGVIKLTFEHNGSAVAEETAMRNQTVRLVRLVFTGPALGTAGTFTNQTVQFDLAGKWTKFDKLADDNGNDTVTGTLKVLDNLANYFKVTVVNEDAAIP